MGKLMLDLGKLVFGGMFIAGILRGELPQTTIFFAVQKGTQINIRKFMNRGHIKRYIPIREVHGLVLRHT